MRKGPKVLILDIETSYMEVKVWALGEQYVNKDQIIKDWNILAWAAKWEGEKKVMYLDQRKAKDPRDDKALLKPLWKLMDAADIIIGQNSDRFDLPKLNARFKRNGMQPPSSYKKEDTRKLARKHFGFTSNSLEYMSEFLDVKYKKLKHKKFPGRELWDECLAGNQAAWREMQRYNIHDVLATEAVYKAIIPWDGKATERNVYTDGVDALCKCGIRSMIRYGYSYTGAGKYQRWKCTNCGSEARDKKNLLAKLRGSSSAK